MQALKKLFLKKSLIATLLIFLLGFAGVKLAPDQADAVAGVIVNVVDALVPADFAEPVSEPVPAPNP